MDFGFVFEILITPLLNRKNRAFSTPITLVDHREDDSWHFFCANYLTRIKIKDLNEALYHDPTVNELRELPVGFSAKRKTTNTGWLQYRKSEREHYPERHLPL